MKLIICGASGYVGREVVKQSLRHPAITEVVAVSRTPIQAPEDIEGSDGKLKSVTVEDYDRYSKEVRNSFAGASGCIWTVAITPSRSRTYPWSEVVRVCQTSTTEGLRAMLDSDPAKPFRFLYMSGAAASRNPDKPTGALLNMMGFAPYIRLRGEVENQVIEIAKLHPGVVEVGFVNTALITSNETWVRAASRAFLAATFSPTVTREDIAAVMIEQVISGFRNGTSQMEVDDINKFAASLRAGSS